MRILVIHQYYRPDVAATAQILSYLCEELARRGHEVHVICSESLYLGGRQRSRKREFLDGVRITRLRSPGGGKNACAFLRILGFISFYVKALVWALIVGTHDVVVTLTTPPFIGLAGRILQVTTGARHVHWCMDVYPDLMVLNGVLRSHSLPHRVLTAVARCYLTNANGIGVLSQTMAERIGHYAVRQSQIRICPVWADGGLIKPVPRAENRFLRRYALDDNFIVMFSGNIGMGETFETILEGAARLDRRSRITFVFIGSGKRESECREFVREHSVANVLCLPYQPCDNLSHSLSAADVHLVTLRKGKVGLRVPSKAYGVLAAGRPIIFIGPGESVIGDMVRRDRVGWHVEDGDVTGFTELLLCLERNRSLASELGQECRKVFEHRYSATVSVNAIVDLIVGQKKDTFGD